MSLIKAFAIYPEWVPNEILVFVITNTEYNKKMTDKNSFIMVGHRNIYRSAGKNRGLERKNLPLLVDLCNYSEPCISVCVQKHRKERKSLIASDESRERWTRAWKIILSNYWGVKYSLDFQEWAHLAIASPYPFSVHNYRF